MLLQNGPERILDFVRLKDGEPSFLATVRLRSEARAATSFLVTFSSMSLALFLTTTTTEECGPA